MIGKVAFQVEDRLMTTMMMMMMMMMMMTEADRHAGGSGQGVD